MMTVAELRRLLDDLPADAGIGVAILEAVGLELEPAAGAPGGVTYSFDEAGRLSRVWITATPTLADYPTSAQCRCQCGDRLWYERGEPRDRVHDHCALAD